MKINQKLYDVLKYVTLVGGPAVAAFIMVLGPVWDLDHVDQAVKTIVAFDGLLGALLLINSAQYTKDQRTTALLLTNTHPDDVAAVTDPVAEVVQSPTPVPAVPVSPTEAFKRQQ